MQTTTYFIALLSTLAGLSVSAQPAPCAVGIDALQKENYEQAVSALSQCLALDNPNRARSFVLQARAESYYRLGKFSDAAGDQRESIRLVDPTDVWSHVKLGVYLRDAGRHEESLSALREAMMYDEDGAGTGPGMAVYYHTAITLHRAKRFSEAIEAVTKGIPKQPDYGPALYQRALSYEALGDGIQAKRDLFRVMELEPREGYAPEVAAKLKEYGFTPRRAQ